jgi:very-short-patch-repair endonuclease
LVSSKIIANRLGKEHNKVLKVLDKIVQDLINKEKLGFLFKENKYKTENQIREYKEYLLTLEGFEVYINSIRPTIEQAKGIKKIYEMFGKKYKVKIIYYPTRFEISFKNLLFEFFEELGITVFHQYRVDKYKLDFYIPKFNLVIEYDEEQHRNMKYEDELREDFIKEKLGSDCNIIRLDYRNSDIKNVAKVLKLINGGKDE